jgi:hypothetical protein
MRSHCRPTTFLGKVAESPFAIAHPALRDEVFCLDRAGELFLIKTTVALAASETGKATSTVTSLNKRAARTTPSRISPSSRTSGFAPDAPSGNRSSHYLVRLCRNFPSTCMI